jgi:hypothetical protein
MGAHHQNSYIDIWGLLFYFGKALRLFRSYFVVAF